VADERNAILDAIDRLAPTLASSGLDELEIEVGEIQVRLARPRAQVAPLRGAAPAAPPSAPAPAPAAPEQPQR
jgi:hypothetical protein